MVQVIVFAGTTEGNEISRFLSENGIKTYVSVATEYGTKSLNSGPFLEIAYGRLEEPAMEELFEKMSPSLIVDATHPYAAVVTESVKQACKAAGIPYYRILREEGDRSADAVYVESTDEAVRFLAQTEGNVLLTTGSKELGAYTAVPDYRERLFARVLSLPDVLMQCSSLGFVGRHLIGMQGPFSRELNEAMLRQFNCKYLVTKDTGKSGGFQEKIDAAFNCGAIPVIIGRPLSEEGASLAEAKKELANRFGFKIRSRVTLLGIGMGDEKTLTLEGRDALLQADLLIGAKRMADSVKMPHHQVVYEYRAEEIASYIKDHPEYQNVVVALSGDVGFYSGARKLLDLCGEDTRLICGISSVVYFMAKIRLSWDDARIVSNHGRNCNLVSLIRYNHKVFSILGTKDGVRLLAGSLTACGMGDVVLYVGENLSYKNEVIFSRKASCLTEYEGDPLSVVCALNPLPETWHTTHGLPDEAFIRGRAPMTKEEIRTVSLSKLRLTEDSVCYDVGAGTGSVSIEMAIRSPQGKVYAIEKKEDALDLIRQNKVHFAADNLEIIAGTAPEAMRDLPSPTHAFIGGSSGNLGSIVEMLLNKNPEVRIVINCITLETVSEALAVVKEHDFRETDIVCISAARSKTVGSYHMMMGENPIYIITCKKQ